MKFWPLCAFAFFAVSSCNAPSNGPSGAASLGAQADDSQQAVVLMIAARITDAFRPCDEAYANFRQERSRKHAEIAQQKCLDASGDLGSIETPATMEHAARKSMDLTLKLCMEAAGARSAWFSGIVKDGEQNAISLNLHCLNGLGDAAVSTGISSEDPRLKLPAYMRQNL